MQGFWHKAQRFWNAAKDVLAVRTLLQWTGWWETVVGLASSIVAGGLLSFWKASWPIIVLVGLFAFGLSSVCWRIWRATTSVEAGARMPSDEPAGLQSLGWREGDPSDPRPEYRGWCHVVFMLAGNRKERVRVFIEVKRRSSTDRLNAVFGQGASYAHEDGQVRPGEQFPVPVFLKLRDPTTLWIDKCRAVPGDMGTFAPVAPGCYITDKAFLDGYHRSSQAPGTVRVRVIVSIGSVARRVENPTRWRRFEIAADGMQPMTPSGG